MNLTAGHDIVAREQELPELLPAVDLFFEFSGYQLIIEFLVEAWYMH